MNWLHYLALAAVLHLPALFVLYALWVQHERGDIWRLDPGWRGRVWWLWKVFFIFGGRGFVLDVIANYTSLALIFGRWPGRAFTFSKQLVFLCRLDGWRGQVANMTADLLDDLAPSGHHINR